MITTPSSPSPTPAVSQQAPTITVSQFANAVRAKAPQGVAADGTPYAKMSDQDLTNKFVEKYPVYAAQIQGYKGASTQPSTQSAKAPAGGQMGTDIQSAGDQLNTDMSDTSTNSLEKGVRASSDVSTGITNVAADVIPGGKPTLNAISKVAGAGVNAAGNISNTLADLATKVHLMSPEQKAAYDKANSDFASSDSGKNISQIATDLAATGNTAGTILGAGEGAAALDKGVGLAKTGVGAVKDAATSAVKGSPAAQQAAQAAKTAAAEQTRTAAGIKDATPDYESMNPTQKAKLRTQPAVNGTPRVQEGGTVKGRTVTPTKSEVAAGTELSKVKGYDPQMTNLEKSNLIQSEITSRAKVVRAGLAKEGIAVPPKEALGVVTKAINKIPDTSLLVSKADPVIKNYTRVVRNAIAKAPGTMEGMLDVRQAMDQAYNNARGGLAYNSDKLASIDEIHKAGRDALNQYITDKAKNTPYEASMKGQTNLYRALDEVGRRADREAGSSVGRFVQQHPALVKGAKTVARTAGLGAVVHLVE